MERVKKKNLDSNLLLFILLELTGQSIFDVVKCVNKQTNISTHLILFFLVVFKYCGLVNLNFDYFEVSWKNTCPDGNLNREEAII